MVVGTETQTPGGLGLCSSFHPHSEGRATRPSGSPSCSRLPPGSICTALCPSETQPYTRTPRMALLAPSPIRWLLLWPPVPGFVPSGSKQGTSGRGRAGWGQELLLPSWPLVNLVLGSPCPHPPPARTLGEGIGQIPASSGTVPRLCSWGYK